MNVTMAVVGTIASNIKLAWVVSAIILLLSNRERPAIRWMYFELRPLYLPACAAYWAEHLLFDHIDGWERWWIPFGVLIDLVTWWFYKDRYGDDDRWQRRAKRVSDVVRNVGHRLVVTPAGAR